jgi:O-antigen ligase
MEQASAPADTTRVVSPVELRIARYLLIALSVAMLVSTSAAVGLEIAAYILFAWSPALRQRLLQTFREPSAIALTIFLAAIVIGALHGAAPIETRIGAIVGWRKALLFYLALATFDSQDAKREILSVFLVVCGLLAVLALALLFLSKPTILIHNSATQGMIFAVAAGVAATAVVKPQAVLAAWFPAGRLLTGGFLLALVGATAFTTWGRSGYLVLFVLSLLLSFWWSRANRARIAASILSALAVVGVLASSDLVRSRIVQAQAEFSAGGTSQTLTSVGVRRVIWTNTIEIIRAHPLLGVGTGSFKAAYSDVVKSRSGWQAIPTDDPHNQFMKVWAEQGLPGLLSLLSFIAAAILSAGNRPEHWGLIVGVLLGWCATSLFSSHFSTFVEGRFIFLWLGVLLAHASAGHESAGLTGRLSVPPRISAPPSRTGAR